MLYRPLELGRYKDRTGRVWRVTHPVHRPYCGPSFAEATRQRWHGYCEGQPDWRNTWDSSGCWAGYCIPQRLDLIEYLGPLTQGATDETVQALP